MSEVMESLAVNETILNALRNAGAQYADAPPAANRRPVFRERPRPSGPGWSSSLDERDLQCLLQVIQADLIPRLLSSYSPARHAPLDRFESPG